MRDGINVVFDEADLYFRDPAFEKPLFPRVSRDAIVDLQAPSRISMKLHLNSLASAQEQVNMPLHQQIHFEQMDRNVWTRDPLHEDFDESSHGTLDYSVDTLDDERITKTRRSQAKTRRSRDLTQPVLPPELEEMVIKADDAINQEVATELDVHARTKEDECFGFPIGWLTSFLNNLMR